MAMYVTSPPASSLVANLGSEVVSEHAELLDLEFSDQWLLLVEAEAREGREVTGLVEQIQVVQGKLLLDGLINFNKRLVLFPIAVVCGQLDKSVTGRALN